MFKNVASQKIALFAFDTTTGEAKSGDAANITAYVSKDYGSVTALTDSSAAEMDATNAAGWYAFDLTQAETNANALLFTGKSSTSNISVVGCLIHTMPANFTALAIDSGGATLLQTGTGTGQLDFTSGVVKANVTQFGSSNGTFSTGIPLVGVGAVASGVDFSSTMKASINAEADAALADVGLTSTVTGRIDATVSSRLAAGSYSAPASAGTIADAVWDEALSGHTTGGSAGAAQVDTDLRGSRTVVRGTVGSSSTTTSIITSAFSPAASVADQLKGRIVVFDNDTTTAALRGQATDITASSNSSTPTLTVTALTTAPASGDSFSVL